MMVAKRIFDLLFSLMGILVLAPIFLAIAVWIKVDSPGSVFFRQVRVGQFGKEFRIYKFRTMVTNAEALGKQITVGEDPRITDCGRFLRKYKLDELPQLFNVLKGDMSLVGSRPEVPKYVALYTPEQLKVLELPPGITDLASIRFRNESELLAQAENPEEFYVKEIMPQKLELNKQYLAQANLIFDLYIILQTLWRLGFE
ncbi:UDP-N-acetylgalactosamine-undecaprenyl-phosphate N-acetylgalactosaminephosphotransferase [Microcystis aeruginosa NIES-2520]|jgi:lipopolysaccharide/colanic/teichoic acid biosynthesis glycosyltransferase|uniref:UDP-N-acetylgalactosamine-undecaprenyl-phosphate N-acetylgalactosaminephosphotransferase n=1 Tax=Microcystis aeruginosa NIES-2520 TaxID=2303982 RepID=A0A5A5RVL3_MICAE|nr:MULTISPECIES: sugar transferase [Microcystis]GCA77221.1 UDP-N-acetylgalactosamine-undecaprenyl-phosphate N-acetylgalactosaminephosphotransferase [Microcystis aeruginosa NIES-2520]